jgi:H+/Cl- antiporter ClcA
MWELPLFCVLAVFGGLMGAVFNHWQFKLSHWRRDHVAGKYVVQRYVFFCLFVVV